MVSPQGLELQDLGGYEADLKLAYENALAVLVLSVLNEPRRLFKHRRLHRRLDQIESLRWAVHSLRQDCERDKVTYIKNKRSRR